jgi:hypothetical protein
LYHGAWFCISSAWLLRPEFRQMSLRRAARAKKSLF